MQGYSVDEKIKAALSAAGLKVTSLSEETLPFFPENDPVVHAKVEGWCHIYLACNHTPVYLVSHFIGLLSA